MFIFNQLKCEVLSLISISLDGITMILFELLGTIVYFLCTLQKFSQDFPHL